MLISAPRRVGKTSFVRNTHHPDYQIKYLITESINRPNEFFERLYKNLLEDLSQSQSIWEKLSDIVTRNQIEKIGASGIEIKATDLNYFEEFRLLVKKAEFDKSMVYVIDEFSETLENIIMDMGDQEGKQFLHQNRELRQDPDVKRKIQFVYSDSIGLDNIAERINASKAINDLGEFTISSLTKEEGKELIRQAIVEENLNFNDEDQNYLLDKIYWLMPFYIQIILDEMDAIMRSKDLSKVDQNIIDTAFENSLQKRNYFEHWHNWLRAAFNRPYYTFAKEALNLVLFSALGHPKIFH